MTTLRYRTIVADPPWPFQWTGGGHTRVNGRGERHINKNVGAKLPYPTMSIDEICALDVAALAEPDAHLYLWIPDTLLIDGVGARVVKACAAVTPRCGPASRASPGSGRAWRSSRTSTCVDAWQKTSFVGYEVKVSRADYRTNSATQIRWGLGYIAARYGTPCDALRYSDTQGSY